MRFIAHQVEFESFFYKTATVYVINQEVLGITVDKCYYLLNFGLRRKLNLRTLKQKQFIVSGIRYLKGNQGSC